jgi:hypothetical protein
VVPLRTWLALASVIGAAWGCGRLEIGVEVVDAEAPDAGDDASGGDASRCLPPDHGWPGCSASGCTICSNLVTLFPLYFENHERCEPTDDCHGRYATCSSDCPEPAQTDQCNGTPDEWIGCRGSGCSVCAELVKAYPRYFERHRNCIRNEGCDATYFQCSAACPAPTPADR